MSHPGDFASRVQNQVESIPQHSSPLMLNQNRLSKPETAESEEVTHRIPRSRKTLTAYAKFWRSWSMRAVDSLLSICPTISNLVTFSAYSFRPSHIPFFRRPPLSSLWLCLVSNVSPFLVILIPTPSRASRLYHGPACTYCSLGSAWELLEDVAPRLVLFCICK